MAVMHVPSRREAPGFLPSFSRLRGTRFASAVLVAASALAMFMLAGNPAAAGHIGVGVGFGFAPCCAAPYYAGPGPGYDEPPPGYGGPPPGYGGPPPPAYGGPPGQPPPPPGQAAQPAQPSGAPAGQAGQTVQPAPPSAQAGQTAQPANCKQGQWRQPDGSTVNGTACQQADGSWKIQ